MTFEPDTRTPCRIRAATNFNERKGDGGINMLVLHYTGMETAADAVDRLCSASSEVSCHYLVHEDGEVLQMVPERLRAWHAGRATWRGASDLNSRSIGIELVNPGHEFGYREFPEEQIKSLCRLCNDIIQRNAIDQQNVVGHSDIAPDRKQDPGELFPWGQLYRAGIGHWVPAEPSGGGRFFSPGESGEPVAALQSMLALFGYDADVTGYFDKQTEDCVIAFQRRFRQDQVDGIADVSTVATLHKLLQKLPKLDSS